jgi:hypothetical protein
MMTLMMLAVTLAAAQEAPQDVVPMIERTQSHEIRYGRSDGSNTWSAGPYSGTWSGRASSMNVMNIRRRNTTRTQLTVNGPGFEDGTVSLSCAGGEFEFELFWITWERERLSYVCEISRNGEPIDSRFELAFQRGRGLLRAGRNERAGQMVHEGQTVQFETQRLSGIAFPSGKVPGYLVRADGHEIAGMDYGVIRSTLYLPDDDDPHREIALLTTIALATFFDPANMPGN